MRDIAQIEPELKEMLSENRYAHCVNTQKIASFLAQHYVVNPQKVSIAALLHDCAKDLSVDLLKDYIVKYEIVLDEIEKNESKLWHGPVGVVLAKEKFGITDEEIGRAIRIHSTLDKNPSTLEKIIYVSDYMDYRESKEDEKSCERLKNIAITELDIVTLWIVNFKILDIMKYRGIIHPRSIEVRNELVHGLKDKMKYYEI